MDPRGRTVRDNAHTGERKRMSGCAIQGDDSRQSSTEHHRCGNHDGCVHLGNDKWDEGAAIASPVGTSAWQPTSSQRRAAAESRTHTPSTASNLPDNAVAPFTRSLDEFDIPTPPRPRGPSGAGDVFLADLVRVELRGRRPHLLDHLVEVERRRLREPDRIHPGDHERTEVGGGRPLLLEFLDGCADGVVHLEQRPAPPLPLANRVAERLVEEIVDAPETD